MDSRKTALSSDAHLPRICKFGYMFLVVGPNAMLA
jgi:hypothetical protein